MHLATLGRVVSARPYHAVGEINVPLKRRGRWTDFSPPPVAVTWSYGPEVASPGLSKELRTHFYERLGSMLRLDRWFAYGGGRFESISSEMPQLDRDRLDRIDERIRDLAVDPAHAGKISKASVEEAAVACCAELWHVVSDPMQRENSGSAEYVGATGIRWDVKSPCSPAPDAQWTFDAAHQIEKLRHDFNQGDRVLLNLSLCHTEHVDELMALIDSELTENEKAKVLILRAP